MKRILLLLLCFPFVQALAQSPMLQGFLVKEGGAEPVAGARVSAVLLSDSTRYAVFSKATGQFALYLEQAGSYGVTITGEGYESSYRVVEIPAGGLIMPQPIGLTASYELETVTIEAEQAVAQQKGDTTEYNAGAFTTNPDATAADLLSKMPGITQQGGQTTAQGEQVQQVLVDGKPFFGNDPQAALNNLPAEVVQKIQVFDQQSEQAQFTGFNDGQTTRTINIITKPETRNGTFGTAYAGYGYEDRYRAGGNYNYFNNDQRLSIVGLSNNINQQNFSADDLLGVASSGGGGQRGGGGFGGRGGGGGNNVGNFLVGESGGISTTQAFGINYSDKIGKKLQFSGSYFFNLTDNMLDQNLLQQVITGRDTGQVYTETLTSQSRNINHRANLRFDFTLSERTSLTFMPRVTLQQNEGSSLTEGRTALGDAILNSSNIDFGSDLSATDANAMLLLRHRFEKPGRTLSLRVQGGYNNSTGNNSQYSELSYFSSLFPSDTIDQQATLLNDGYDATVNATWTENVGKIGQLSTWYEYAPRWNDSDQRTFTQPLGSAEYTQLDTFLSNTFESAFRRQELGTGLRLRLSKGFLMARVSLQEATLNNELRFPQPDTAGFTYYNVLPMLMLRMGERGSGNEFFALYRSSTDAPSVSQLQSVINNSNPLQLRSGNPELEQAFQHRLVLRYTKTTTAKSRVFSINTFAQFSQNYIANSSWIARTDTILPGGVFLQRGGQFSQPVNLDGYVNARSFLTFGQLIEPVKTNLNLSLSGGYVRTPGRVNGFDNISQTLSGGMGVVLSSNFSDKVDFTLSSQTDLNNTTSSLQPLLNTQYWTQRSSGRVNLISPDGWVLRTSLDHQMYRGFTDDFNQDFFLWSGGVAKKLFKDQKGELELSVFDILGQNTSISRTATEIYIQDLQQTVLQRYVMLSFRYQLRNFDGALPSGPTPPPGGFGPGGPGMPPGGRP